MSVPSWLRVAPRPYTTLQPARTPESAVRGGPIWERMLEAAKASGHPDPEKMADSMFRSREKAIALKAARHHTNLVPFQAESKPCVELKMGPSSHKCKATTLANKPCQYKATFCGYCSKHVPSDAILKLTHK